MREKTHRHVSETGSVSFWDARASGELGHGHDVTACGVKGMAFEREEDAIHLAARIAATIRRDTKAEDAAVESEAARETKAELRRQALNARG